MSEEEEQNIHNEEEENGNGTVPEEKLHDVLPVSGMYENWFLEYASYVILERAVPDINDGLKPVQRRILHSMREIEDGRYNKVANVIGHTMQYHPHGDAAIGDAMVNLGQKELLIDTQGNWGDIRTGDSAAAARYIEARLSKFALDVVFNPDTTDWQLSYDGRRKEPITLPVKFPLVLAQGVEGIAVGLSTKILPHNFIELCQGSINILKGKSVVLYPDFLTGGSIDISNYNSGKRGGRIRVRARIEEIDKKTLVIRDIPYGTTTTNLIDSIIKANDDGKIKIKKVIDNTAQEVEILIELNKGTSPDITIDALYAFTDCESSIAPNACVIVDGKPRFMGVDEILRISTERTRDLLRRELEIRLAELESKWHFSSLEKIFIENRIYRRIEEEETWEGVIRAIDTGLDPFKKLLRREVTEEDIVRLTEIKIKRISKFDSFKADELIRSMEAEMEEVKHNLNNLTEFAIHYFEDLIKKYGKGRERKSEIRVFDTIQASEVAAANVKLYVDREEGFIGYGLKKSEFITDCSDIDDIIVFRNDGKYVITRISDKNFVGKGILHVDVWKKDERMVYNAAYVDGKTAVTRVKRFNVTAATRDKEYDVTKGTKNSRLTYFSANPNSEAEVVNVQLSDRAKARVKKFDYDFAELDIKNRNAQGNILTKYPVRKITLKEKGQSTLGGRDIWFDNVTGRLNVDDRGRYLGNFDTGENILVIYKDGSYELTDFELTNRYEVEQIEVLEKFEPEAVISCIYYSGQNKRNYIKRFKIETTTVGKKFPFIDEHNNSSLLYATILDQPVVEVKFRNRKTKKVHKEELDLAEWQDVTGWRALGRKITGDEVVNATLLRHEQPERSEGGGEGDSGEGGGESNLEHGTLNLEQSSAPEKKFTKKEAEPEEKTEASKTEQNPKPSAPNLEPGTLNIEQDKAEAKPKLKPGETVEFDLKKERKFSPKKKGSGDKGSEGQLGLF